MAIYRLSAQVIGRARKNSSAVAAAAYRAGEKLYDERMGRTENYLRKPGVVHTEILAPEGAPAWVFDRGMLWNAVEKRENYAKGTLARELQLALPVELERAQRIELVRGFVQEQLVARGMVADLCFHEPNDENPHVHVLLTMRSLGPEGFGNKERSWNSRELLYEWRESWALHVNRALARAGHEERVDHRSYEKQGLPFEAQPKMRVHAATLEASLENPSSLQAEVYGKDRLEQYRVVARENGERILAEPEVVLRLLTQQRSTFRREDLSKVLNTHTLDAAQFEACLSAVMGCPDLVKLWTDASGVERFTSRELLDAEGRMYAVAGAMHGSGRHRVQAELVEQATRSRPELSAEQHRALVHLTSGSASIAVLEGRAGTGKSFLLGAAREAWQAQGLYVVGGALAGKAAEGLTLSSGIEARTLASWEYAWQNGTQLLTKKHVLVIDEAGMVGTRQLERVLSQAHKAGAKVVLVGDSQQLQAIEAGSPFRSLSERVGSVELSEIRRQREEWQREATRAFSERRAGEGLEAYFAHGQVHAHHTTEEARAKMVSTWAADQQTLLHERLMIAYRRDDVAALNALAREALRAQGKLGEEQVFATELGERSFAVGDRVLFGKNDARLGLTNGTLGTIEGLRGSVMLVKLDGEPGKQVFVDLGQYRHVDHGYAVTAYKSQGMTVERSYVLASRLFDSFTSYVALSRQREHAELHWARDEFGSEAELKRTLTRERVKEMASEGLEPAQPAQVTLKEALADESRFAQLAPREQRRLVEEYSALLKRELERSPLQSTNDLYNQMPEVHEGHKRIREAEARYAKAAQALEGYPRLGFFERLKVNEAELRKAAEQTREAMFDTRRAVEREQAGLRHRAEEKAGQHNMVHVRNGQRLKGWQDQVLGYERSAMLAEAVERLPGYRVADEASLNRALRVTGLLSLPPLSNGQRMYVAALIDEQGRGVLVEVPNYVADHLEKGQRVALSRQAGGELALNTLDRGPDRGHGR